MQGVHGTLHVGPQGPFGFLPEPFFTPGPFLRQNGRHVQYVLRREGQIVPDPGRIFVSQQDAGQQAGAAVLLVWWLLWWL